MSPSTSVPAKVRIVASAAIVSNTSTAANVPRTGASFTALTTKEIVFASETVPSEMLKTRSPIPPKSELAFSLGVKTIPSKFSTVNVSPAAMRVPSANARVPPVGRLSTVIVRVSPSTSITETVNADAVSSVNEKELVSREGASFTGLTVKEILEVLELEPSLAVNTRFPKEFKSELAFSAEAKEMLESCEVVN